MRSLVTGGAGFIGSHMVDLLLAEGHEVVVLDNLSTGHLGNLGHLENNSNFNFHEIDVRSSEEIKPYFEGVDWVFHFAALADIVPSIQRPLGYIRAGADATVSVLEASRLSEVSRFVYAASSSCYGLAKTPTSENSPIFVEYPYALSKFQGEEACFHWAKVYGLNVNSIVAYMLPIIQSRLLSEIH